MATKVITNLVPDPRFVNLDNTDLDLLSAWYAWWPAGGGAGNRTVQTGESWWNEGITTSGRITFTSAGTLGEGGGIARYDMRVEPGKPLALRGQYRSNQAQRLLLWVDLANEDRSSYTPGYYTAMTVPANTTAELTLEIPEVPEGYVWADVYIMGNYPAAQSGGVAGSNWLAGSWVATTGWVMTQDMLPGAPPPAFFDGNTVDAPPTTYAWTGTPTQSPSQKTTVTIRGLKRTDSPFRITTYDKAFQRTGWVGAYEDFTVTPMHNAIGQCGFTLSTQHPRVADLMAPGARVVVEYLGNGEDEFVLSGPVRSISGAGPAARGSIRFGVEDDYRVLTQILAWPNPGESIFNQGYDDDGESLGDYDHLTGPAETVMKGFVNANVPRLGLPLVTAPDLLRGSDIDVRMRFHPLTDRLIPAVETDGGLGVRVRQASVGVDGGGLVLDVYVPTIRERVISEASGILHEWSWNQAAPTNTRVVVGGQGEGIDRDFRLKTDTARETEWGAGFISEQFRDARDVELGNYDLLDKRADQSLAEGAAKTGLKITLAETDTFRYGRTMAVGDKITIEIASGIQVSDTLRSATLSHTPQDGLLIVPAGGEPSDDDPDMLYAKAIASLATGLRDLKAGR